MVHTVIPANLFQKFRAHLGTRRQICTEHTATSEFVLWDSSVSALRTNHFTSATAEDGSIMVGFGMRTTGFLVSVLLE